MIEWWFWGVVDEVLWCGVQWDEGLLTMSKGETARLEIESEWAYGKKGLPDSKYPSVFDVVQLRLPW